MKIILKKALTTGSKNHENAGVLKKTVLEHFCYNVLGQQSIEF